MFRRILRRKYIIAFLILLAAVLIALRLYLSVWLLEYVNRSLNDIKGYKGSVERIELNLYRGAYKIHGLKLLKKTSGIPVPFVAIDTVDFSIQWGALLHGRVVSDVTLLRPVLNFAVGKNGKTEQMGEGVDWSKAIKDLMPIDINLVTLREGKLSYQDFSTRPQVNVYIDHMEGEVRNLRNVVDEKQPLPSPFTVRGESIGKGRLDMQGRVNILRPVPDMDMDLKLEKVHLPALSNYSNAYAAIDIKEGNLDVYSELKIKNNHVSGYVKPIATHMALINLRETNPVKLAWEVVVSVITEIFTNQRKDQFATKIDLEGNLDNISTDSWSAFAGIVRNAFIQSFHKGLDNDIKMQRP